MRDTLSGYLFDVKYTDFLKDGNESMVQNMLRARARGMISTIYTGFNNTLSTIRRCLTTLNSEF